MSGFTPKPYSYNGTQINDGATYTASFHMPDGFAMQKPELIEVDRHAEQPVMVDKKYKPLDFKLYVTILNPATFTAATESLKALFDPRDRTLRTLIVKDSGNGDKQYQRQCTVIEAIPVWPDFVVTLHAPDPVYASVTQNSDTWNLTTSGSTHTIAIGGNVATQPVFQFTPTIAKTGGFGYKEIIISYNPGATAMPNRGYELTGGWNTAAEVTAGRMQSAGQDLRVYVDGAETNRWLSGINGASTKVWITLGFSPKIEASVAAITTTATSLSLQPSRANTASFNNLPTAGSALIDAEAVSWTGKTPGAGNGDSGTLTGLTRGARNTSAGSHAAAATLRWLEHDIQIMHGNSTLAAPTVDNTAQPISDLTGGDTSWVYGTNMSTLGGKRAGEWKGKVVSSLAQPAYRTTDIYTKAISGTAIGYADPSTAMGLHIASFLSGGVWRQEGGEVFWQISDPAGFTAINPAGNTYRDTGVTWPVATLEVSTDGRVWTTVLTVASPATGLAAWAPGNQTLGATYNYARFRFKTSKSTIAAGAGANGTGNEADWEITSVTMTLDSTAIPQLTFGARAAAYELQATLTNTDSGESIGVHYTLPLNTTLEVDPANKKVTFKGDGTSAYNALSRNSIRQHWLDIAGNATLHLSFVDTGTNGVTVTTLWYDKEI